MQLVESLFPDQGLNPGPQQWEHGVLTTRPPENSQELPTFNQFLSRDLPTEQTGRDWVFLGLAEIRGQWRGQTKEAIIGTLDKGGMNKLMGDIWGELNESEKKCGGSHAGILV